MLQDKSVVVDKIIEICDKNVANKNYIKSVMQEAYNRYLFPMELSYSILTANKSKEEMNEMNNFTLFAFLDCLAPKYIPEFFTNQEQKNYKIMHFESDNELELPLILNMVQISENQWIGKITVKQLMQLRNARKIRYNENTQRTLRRIVKNGEETYRISLNAKAVEAIKQSYLSGTYIANTITLNMPETTVYKYNAKSNQLAIEELDFFDILDGYHRYIAMAKIFDGNQDFDYEMELRLVMFGEEKARQFIWQEDQKTKMRKIDSESMNQNNPGVQVVNELNQTAPFTGKINNNEGIINAAIMAETILIIGFNGKDKADRKSIIETKKKIISVAKMLEDENPILFDEKWDQNRIFAFILCCFRSKNEEICDNFDKIYDRIKSDPYFSKGHANSQMISKVGKLW